MLYVDVSRKFGGSIVSLLSRLQHLDKERFKPLVLCRVGPQADAVRELGVKTEAVDVPSFPSKSSFRVLGAKIYNPLEFPRHGLICLGVLGAASRLFRDEGFDIVHGSGLFSNLYASIAGFLFRKPVVWHINDFDPRRNRTFFRLLSGSVAKVIAISERVRRMLTGLGIPSEKMTTIYQPIDHRVFRPMNREGCRQRLGLERKGKIVGFVGRLELEKGLDHFLWAGADIVKRFPETTLLVAGEGYDKRYLTKMFSLVDSLHLGGKILFLGFRRDTPWIFNALDVLVFPSVCEEGFGRVVAEASVCGVPTVATDVGGVREIVEDGVTGVLVPRGDVSSMAREVIGLLKNASKARRMGIAGRERAMGLFSPRLHIRQVEGVYEEVFKI